MRSYVNHHGNDQWSGEGGPGLLPAVLRRPVAATTGLVLAKASTQGSVIVAANLVQLAASPVSANVLAVVNVIFGGWVVLAQSIRARNHS